MNALLDTNILIDYLNGLEAARDEINLYRGPCISPVTWMEVMVGVSDGEAASVRRFLSGFQQIPIDAAVAEIAVTLRRDHRMRLPDAIIWASAQHIDALLVTRNTKDFPDHHPGVRVPYQV